MEHFRTDPVHKNNLFYFITIGLWFSWQELNGRRIVFAINLILIALLIAFAVTLDFMGKARKSSIEKRIDYIGPSLSLVPKGIRSSDLATAQLKGKTYSQNILDNIRRDFSSLLRGVEARLIMNVHVGQKAIPLVGIDFREVHSYPLTQYSLMDDEVLAGNIAAQKLKKDRGDQIQIQARTFTINGIMETTGGIDDVSLFMPLPSLQEFTEKRGLINEIRLFPRSASSFKKLKKQLNELYPQIDIVDSYRGDTAEEDIETTLRDYQKVVYAVAFVLIAFCIVISTYINLDGRKSEISTIYTLGATQGIIFQILTLRTIWIALLGSLSGHVLALFTTFLQDYHISFQYIWSWKSFAFVVLGTVFLGVLVTIPFTIYSVYKRNLISDL